MSGIGPRVDGAEPDEVAAATDGGVDTLRRHVPDSFPHVLAATAGGELAFGLDELEGGGGEDEDFETVALADAEGASRTLLMEDAEEGPEVDIEDEEARPRSRPRLPVPVPTPGTEAEVSRLKEEREILLRHLQHANRRLQARVENQWMELRQQSQRLAAANRAKDLLLARTSHDVRNGVGVVLAYASLLGPEVPAESREHLRSVEQACRHLVELLDDLVDEATLASGAWSLRAESFRLDVLLDSVTAQLRDGPFRRKHQRLDVVMAEDFEFAVLADRKRIGQVLRNYIDNASKYSSPGTTVRVEIRKVEAAVEVEVLDEGPGIPAGAESRLFEPTADIGNRPTAGEKSTGVGLSLVADVIRRHGGRVWGTNRRERGAAFGFSLPDSGPPASTSVPSSGTVPGPSPPQE